MYMYTLLTLGTSLSNLYPVWAKGTNFDPSALMYPPIQTRTLVKMDSVSSMSSRRTFKSLLSTDFNRAVLLATADVAAAEIHNTLEVIRVYSPCRLLWNRRTDLRSYGILLPLLHLRHQHVSICPDVDVRTVTSHIRDSKLNANPRVT